MQLRSGGSVDRLTAAKEQLEALLRKVIVRTERLASTPDRGGMLVERAFEERIDTSDLRAYVALQRVCDAVGHSEPMELWKSAPYVLNFSEGYELRKRLHEAVQDEEHSATLQKELAKANGALLPVASVRRYRRLPAANARLRGFVSTFLDGVVWKLLWMPPSLPYYRMEGAFAHPNVGGVTKRLVFSAWRAVPRSICAVLGHNVIANALASMNAKVPGATAGEAKLPVPLLRFNVDSDDRLTGLPLFSLVFPSWTLATVLDPLTIARELRQEGAGAVEFRRVREVAIRKARALLDELRRVIGTAKGAADERWYGLAGGVLDWYREPQLVESWLASGEALAAWTHAEEDEGTERGGAHWRRHAEMFQELATTRRLLGPMPDDLAEVVADTGLAGPATVALRALLRGASAPTHIRSAMTAAASIGSSLVGMFNLPDSIAVVKADSATEPYWRRVLEYAGQGCLQAVLDEYLHTLLDSDGVSRLEPGERVLKLAETVRSSVGIRAAPIAFDDIKMGDQFSFDVGRLSSRFAMPLIEQRATDTGTESARVSERTRTMRVRDAFNSPFWPFVLASTSIGQEGLDFHLYSHAVVHWNLPSNPVDLEQREGRVHRYKNHAVRKNVAARYGQTVLASTQGDVWADLFRCASNDRPANTSELIPFWIFHTPSGASIERHLPHMPLSREENRIIDLRRTLVMYRMVFGQPRQEDLIKYLLDLNVESAQSVYESLKIDLSPRG